jgi:hypothetical protein
MIENADKPTMDGFVRKVVSDKVDLIATDEAYGYRDLAPSYPHQFVRHSAGEYVAATSIPRTLIIFGAC